MAEEIGFENGRNSNFQGLVTLTLTLDPAIRHTVVHNSSTSTCIPNFIEIEETFCGRTDGRTYGRTFFPSNIIRSTFGSRLNNIIIITMTILLSSWPGHCESSLGSSGEYRTAPSGRRPSDQATWLGLRVRLFYRRTRIFLGDHHAPVPRSGAIAFLNFLGPPIYARTVRLRATKFGMITHTRGNSAFPVTLPSQGSEDRASPKFFEAPC